MTKLKYAVCLCFIILNLSAYSQVLLGISGGASEVEVATSNPGVTLSFPVVLENMSGTETALDIEPNMRLSQYDFLGGSFPGVGGDCTNSLAPGQACTIFLETSPSDVGDRDDYMDFDYIRLSFFGEYPPPRVQHSIKIDGYSYPSSCTLKPKVDNILNRIVVSNTSETVTVRGHNFSSGTTINIPGIVINSVNINSFSEIKLNVTGAATAGTFDINITNECGSYAQADAITVIDEEWVDLTTSPGVAQLGIEASSGGVGAPIIDPTLGVQFDITTNQTWNKAIRFNNFCDSVDSDFDIIIYRSGTSKRLLVSLFGQDAQVDPYVGQLNFRKQYIGLWNYGAGVSTIWGTESGEGGQNWNATWGSANTPAGKYYRFHFQNAGQAGSNIELWEVDSNFNDIVQLDTWVSTKPVSPSTVVCPGISPYDGGVSDYYVAGVRVQ